MKWAEIEGTHVNTNTVTAFYWVRGRLYVFFIGDDEPTGWDDPDGEVYLKLCRQQGIRPAMEDN